MEIPKFPPIPADSAAGAPTAGVPTRLGERAGQAPSATNAAADRSGIKPLDLASALKILLTEVRLALIDAMQSPLRDPNDSLPQFVHASAPEDAVPQAARGLVELLLRFVPDGDMSAEVLNQTVSRLQAAMEAAGQNAIERVSAWRDTPASIPDMLQQARTLAIVVIGGEVPSNILMRPEWLDLAPRIARLRRRLRRRGVSLTDADADHVEVELKSDPEQHGR